MKYKMNGTRYENVCVCVYLVCASAQKYFAEILEANAA